MRSRPWTSSTGTPMSPPSSPPTSSRPSTRTTRRGTSTSSSTRSFRPPQARRSGSTRSAKPEPSPRTRPGASPMQGSPRAGNHGCTPISSPRAGHSSSAPNSVACPSIMRPSPRTPTSPSSPRPAPWSPCCRASSSPPASPIPTLDATSTPECAWRSPRTAIRAPGSPTACPSPSPSASGTCTSPSNRRCGRQRPEVPTPCSEPTSVTSGWELAPTWPSSTHRAAVTWPTGPVSNSSNASTPAVNSSPTTDRRSENRRSPDPQPLPRTTVRTIPKERPLMSDLIDLDPDTLTFAEVVDVARHDAKVRLSEATLARVNKYREAVDALAQAEKPVYGVSTGFGALAQRHIPTELRTQLQKSLIRSHAAGVGEPVEREVVRALMLLRARTMATGRAGGRAEVLQTSVDLLNAGITPVVPDDGSLGGSGDLAPLSACALVVMGEGVAEGPDGVAGPADEILKAAGIAPVTLVEKEGLALVNGTDGMLGMLIMALTDLENLLTAVDVSAAMSIEGLFGTDAVFAPELHYALRPHDGQSASAANMLTALKDSAITASHRESTHLVQDAYSMRCAPQVNGAARDAVAFATG